ncbi:MAG: LysR family transcriptional regulator [Oscillospiraceae bacterium]|nr:LysR family transcriptional regulator [Oscillospiraceae bacterium]
MQIFRTLCENEYNTTKAAQALNMTQPAVSLAIKELEQHYEVVLFDRIGRRLVITPAGTRLEEYCRSIETLFDDMETEMKNWDKHGVIRVGATLTIGARFLPAYVKAFEKIYPDISVKGLCAAAGVLENKILDNELDIAFSEGIVLNPLIVSEEYMDDHLIIIAPADGKYTPWQEISVEELCTNKFVMREYGSGTRKVFDIACEKAGFHVEPVWECASNDNLLGAVINGIGVGVLSHKLLERAINSGLVVPLRVKGLNLSRKFYIIRHKDKKLSQAVKYFLYLCNNNDFDTADFF